MGEMNPLEKCEKCPDFIFEDVQAYIQQLEAKVPKWISVDESMPDGFVPVLGHIIDAFNFPHVRECYRIEDAFYFPELRDIHTISHWMPMPEPPKEEEKMKKECKFQQEYDDECGYIRCVKLCNIHSLKYCRENCPYRRPTLWQRLKEWWRRL